MVLAMLFIPTVDGLAKYLSAGYSPLFISFARYAVAGAIVLPIAFLKHGYTLLPERQRGAHFLRTLFLVSAMTCFFLAIAKIELATAVAAFFISPIAATLLAVFFLKEKFNAAKATSLTLGFCGALIILRPGNAISPGILLAIASRIFFAFYMIATRFAARESDPLKTLAFQCLVGAILLLPQALWAWAWPQTHDIPLFLAMGALSAVSHLLSIAAFSHAETSLLAPFVYVELLGATIVGYFAFAEVPAFPVWLGALAIVAGGLVLIRLPARGG